MTILHGEWVIESGGSGTGKRRFIKNHFLENYFFETFFLERRVFSKILFPLFFLSKRSSVGFASKGQMSRINLV